MRRLVAVLLLLLLTRGGAADEAKPQWFRGNTHTHTDQSDGDSPPADVVRWYREHGYHFLVITDHDKVTVTEGHGLLLIPGEEVTDRLPKKPLHVNAIGLRTVVKPQGGSTPAMVMQRNVDAVREAGGLAQINHPNFGWAFGLDVLEKIERATLLEIASGHPLTNMQGGGGVPSVEAMWDALLTGGKRIWAVAVDDSHHFKCSFDDLTVGPGRGWISVRASALTEQAILAAIERGDFYASTGVELEDISGGTRELQVKIREGRSARFRTQFIGARGKLLSEVSANPAVYRIRGGEGYVRAKITDSNGRHAWTQPYFVASRPVSGR
ncbi:MAG TPA: CehA/McbA family metallohydrolase [Thermoanaerobaculia bacterium]|nr:CehA/McbA family metallohydrolase [Thermoanaerobaculia bacterium]